MLRDEVKVIIYTITAMFENTEHDTLDCLFVQYWF